MLKFSKGTKLHIHILCHSSILHDTGSSNHSSSNRRTYLFYVVNTMGVDVLATQGAKASATMILTMLNRINSNLLRLFCGKKWYKVHTHCFMFSEMKSTPQRFECLLKPLCSYSNTGTCNSTNKRVYRLNALVARRTQYGCVARRI